MRSVLKSAFFREKLGQFIPSHFDSVKDNCHHTANDEKYIKRNACPRVCWTSKDEISINHSNKSLICFIFSVFLDFMVKYYMGANFLNFKWKIIVNKNKTMQRKSLSSHNHDD